MATSYKNLLLLVAGVLQASLLSAQLGFSMPTYMNTTNGQILNVPVQVHHFDSIASIQFVLKWDPAVLSFLSLSSYNLPGMTGDNFGLTQAVDSGLVRFAWAEPGGQGTSLPDSATIFRLRLKVVGQDPSGTAIQFTERPPLTIFEAVQVLPDSPFFKIFVLSNTELQDGFVGVGGFVSTETPADQGFTALVAPNPIQPGSMLWLDLPEASAVLLGVSNAAGQLLRTEKLSLPPGKHGMEIASMVTGPAGTYFLTVQTPVAVRIIPLLVH